MDDQNFINGVFQNDEGIYYYVNGQKNAAGFINYENNYYYAGENGQVSTGTFSVNGNSYIADASGKLTVQSVNLSLEGSSSLSTTAGTEASLTLTPAVALYYGEEVIEDLTPEEDSLLWSLDTDFPGVSFTNGTLTVDASAIPGNIELVVNAEISSGDMQASTQKTIALEILPKNPGDFVPDGLGEPEFAYQSLMLEGQIGVNFYMYLPEIEGIDYSDGTQCYMDFDISGDKSNNSQVLDETFSFTKNNMTFYGFRCYINSMQMADKITAVFHYGEQSVLKVYSAKKYLDSDFSAFSDEAKELIDAIRDYGYYSQKLLSKTHNWTIGKEHAEMDRTSTYSAENLAAISEDVQSYAFINGNSEDSGIDSIEYSLNLDSSTAINLYLNLAENYSGEVLAYLGDGNISIADPDLKNNRYKIKIDDIPAHELGKASVITIMAGKTFNVEVSALSYVNTVLNRYTDNTEMCEAVAAVYNYYTATMKYRDSLNSNN